MFPSSEGQYAGGLPGAGVDIRRGVYQPPVGRCQGCGGGSGAPRPTPNRFEGARRDLDPPAVAPTHHNRRGGPPGPRARRPPNSHQGVSGCGTETGRHPPQKRGSGTVRVASTAPSKSSPLDQVGEADRFARWWFPATML